MIHEFRVDYDDAILRDAVRGYWRRTVGMAFPTVLVAMALLLGGLLLHGERGWLVGLLAAVVLFGIGMMSALYVLTDRRLRQKAQAIRRSGARWTLSLDQLVVESALGVTTLPWTSIPELWRFETVWLLMFPGGAFSTLPLATVSSDARSFLLERIRSAGGRIR